MQTGRDDFLMDKIMSRFKCTFRVNTPVSPWRSGSEPLIGSLKRSMKKSFLSENFTYEEFLTFLAKLTYVVNSRPICPKRSGKELTTLTLSPSDFLLSRFENFSARPENPSFVLRDEPLAASMITTRAVTRAAEAAERQPESEDGESKTTKQNQRLFYDLDNPVDNPEKIEKIYEQAVLRMHRYQAQRETLFRRVFTLFKQEYLDKMSMRPKWQILKRAIPEGTLAFIKDATKKTALSSEAWPLCKIVKQLKSHDSVIRDYEVELPSGRRLVRPCTSLAPLDYLEFFENEGMTSEDVT